MVVLQVRVGFLPVCFPNTVQPAPSWVSQDPLFDAFVDAVAIDDALVE